MKKLLLACLSIVVLLPALGLQAVSPANASPDVTPSAQVLQVAQGAYIRPTIEFGQEIADFNTMVGKDLSIIMYYINWDMAGQNGSYLSVFLLDKIRQTFGDYGPAIMLSWQPQQGRMPGCTKDYNGGIPLNDIIAGNCDNYITNFALAIKNRPERFLLRFAPEMNLTSSAWWPGNYGQDASAFVAMYQHVYDVFMAQGVTNAEWVWSPSFKSWPQDAWNDRNNYYPGDDYVDWIGLSGYNWYNTLNDTVWRSFTNVYNSEHSTFVLDDFTCRYAKPQIIAEFGSVEGPGGSQTKASWITDAYQTIPQHPFLRSAIWLNDYAFAVPSNRDFRLTTSSAINGSVKPLPSTTGAWTNAYKQAMSSSLYRSTLPTLEEATPPTSYCGNGEPAYEVDPVSATLYFSHSFTFTAMLNDHNLNLSLQFPAGSGLSGSFSPAALPPPWGVTTLTVQAGPTTQPGIYQVNIQDNGVTLATVSVEVLASTSIYLPVVIKP